MSEQRSDNGTATSDEPSVQVSILHGGFDCARFALMVGVYADEEPSGAERFLDRQFDELLSGWRDAGHYPGPVGTSVFVEPGRDVGEGAEPCGAYLVGLGTGLSLSRSQLRVSVTQALVDRCLRLYPEAAALDGAADAGHVDVGVSTALLGVRDDEGLRVEDAVNAILEGLRDANQTLAHYEQGRRIAPRVRVTRIQFVERYAHRARLAAIAVRRARVAIDLPDTFRNLETVVVEQGVPEAGALPAGAAVWERERTWQRYALTSPSQARLAPDGEETGTPLQIEISAMGRDARADRALHRIDRGSLEALMETVAINRTDVDAVRTLRDRLLPYDLRGDFLSAPALHLVVDAVTANYPWELMVGPATSNLGAGAAGTGSVLRMFAESEARRMHPVRAQHRRALVIGAGHTVPGAGLTGAIAEARTVAGLLGAAGFEAEVLLDDENLSDGEQRITLADLNIRLGGDHQIVHLACHGVHEDADPEAAGALLTPTFRLTADFVDALPVVPELAVVNSCYNAKIGLHRLAAGLARSLMGIGVRAVVAAGWPIEDAAAQRFAQRLYTDMLAGRAFGDAVTAARRAATQGHGATWAAYQCYGDPTFVLRGIRATSTPVDTVLSVADLEDRLDALMTEIADLSRPRPGQGHDRRAVLLSQLTHLENRAEEHSRNGKVPHLIRRKLAAAATRLGDFDRAASWYRRALTDTTPRRLAARESSPLDLQQAANCLARHARVLVRDGGPDAFEKAVAALTEAEQLATAAVDLLDEDESMSILASVYKKWAATDSAQRDTMVAKSLDAMEGLHGTARGDYGLENRFQLVALENRTAARRLVDKAQARVPVHAGARCRDEAPHRGVDYWARAVRGDMLLTDVMTAETAAEATAAAQRMVTAYEDAFRRRSTFAERYSSIDHLQDLVDLLPPDDHRRAPLDDALTAVAMWRGFSVSARSEPAAGTLTTRSAAPAPAPARSLRGDLAVSVDAVHAGCGDCLLVTYQGADGVEHRMLIDGGLGADYAAGLGRVVGDAGPPFSVDVAVVSHIDSDHIGGMLEALGRGRVQARDFWFNGRDQIADLIDTTAKRSARQGDALSGLVPTDRRNRAVGGGAMVVGPDGLLDVDLPGGAHVVLLSPSRERLAALLKRWPERVRDAVDEVDRLLAAFEDPVERATRTMGHDPSEPNGSSIAFLFEHDGASVLFTADAWASELETSLAALLERRRSDDPTLAALQVSLFKLSHHGSMNNVTEKLLRVVAPERLLICTDGSKTYEHPDVETLDLVAEVYPGVPVLFTDDTPVIRNRAAHIGAAVPDVTPVRIVL